jgi:hypothetical protein
MRLRWKASCWSRLTGWWADPTLFSSLTIRPFRARKGMRSIKKGTRSVGVAPQYASALGKTANCQTLVSLTLARDEVPAPVSLRLFLPEAWTNDPERLGRAGVPSSEPHPPLQARDRAG